jgi:hypothetical protein
VRRRDGGRGGDGPPFFHLLSPLFFIPRGSYTKLYHVEGRREFFLLPLPTTFVISSLLFLSSSPLFFIPHGSCALSPKLYHAKEGRREDAHFRTVHWQVLGPWRSPLCLLCVFALFYPSSSGGFFFFLLFLPFPLGCAVLRMKFNSPLEFLRIQTIKKILNHSFVFFVSNLLCFLSCFSLEISALTFVKRYFTKIRRFFEKFAKFGLF